MKYKEDERTESNNRDIFYFTMETAHLFAVSLNILHIFQHKIQITFIYIDITDFTTPVHHKSFVLFVYFMQWQILRFSQSFW